MSTILLILLGIVAAILLLVGIGYLLDRFGVTGKVGEAYEYMVTNFPKFKRWLKVGAVALGLLGVVIILLLILLP